MTVGSAALLSDSLRRRVLAEQRYSSVACFVLGGALLVEALTHSPAVRQLLPPPLWYAAEARVVSFALPLVALATLWLLVRRRRVAVGLHPRGSGTGALALAVLLAMVLTPLTVLLAGAGVWLGGALIAVGARAKDLALVWTGLGVTVTALWAAWQRFGDATEAPAVALTVCAVAVLTLGAVRRRDERRTLAIASPDA
nr:hypothetical protein [uncultured Actinotalea sp.]